MSCRSCLLLFVGLLAAVALVAAGFFLGLTWPRPTLKPHRALAPITAPPTILQPTPLPQPTATPLGQWITLPTASAAASTPTLPPGAFLFRGTFGGLVQYVPPSAQPQLSWKTYTNQADGYSISYPSDWIVTKSTTNGHQGLSLYPPGTDLHQDVPGGPQGITFGWTNDPNVIPTPTDPDIADLRAITIDGQNGQLYTVASLGRGINAVFPRPSGGYLALESSAEQDILLVVFQHMLNSLKFF